jgi:dihydroneopterin aldolase
MIKLTKLTISNATFYAYHGVEKAEKQLGGKYEVDLDLWYNALNAISNDAIGQAINYQNVLFAVSDFIQNENYNLIETLAYNILNNIMEQFPLLKRATIRIRKCNVPIRHTVDYVEVEQTTDR